MHAPSLVQTATQDFKYKRSPLIKSELQQLTLKHRHSIDIISSGHEHIMDEWHITKCRHNNVQQQSTAKKFRKNQNKKKPIPIFAPP